VRLRHTLIEQHCEYQQRIQGSSWPAITFRTMK